MKEEKQKNPGKSQEMSEEEKKERRRLLRLKKMKRLKKQRLLQEDVGLPPEKMDFLIGIYSEKEKAYFERFSKKTSPLSNIIEKTDKVSKKCLLLQ